MVNKDKVRRAVLDCRVKRILLLGTLGWVFVELEKRAIDLVEFGGVFDLSFAMFIPLAFVLLTRFDSRRDEMKAWESLSTLVESPEELDSRLRRALKNACDKRGIEQPEVRLLSRQVKGFSPISILPRTWKRACLLVGPETLQLHDDEIEANIAHELHHDAWSTLWASEFARSVWRWLLYFHCLALVSIVTPVILANSMPLTALLFSTAVGFAVHRLIIALLARIADYLSVHAGYDWKSASLLQAADSIAAYRNLIALAAGIIFLVGWHSPRLAAAMVNEYSMIVLLFVLSFLMIQGYMRQVEFEADARGAADQGTARPLIRLLARMEVPTLWVLIESNRVSIYFDRIKLVQQYLHDRFDVFKKHPALKERIKRLTEFEQKPS